jgi:hypothetical protein
MTGPTSYRPASPSTSSTSSASSLRCSKRASPIAKARWSTGVRRVRRCWPTSRSKTGCAGAVSRWSPSASLPSGFCASPSTPSRSSMTWGSFKASGPTKCCTCRKTGSVGRKARGFAFPCKTRCPRPPRLRSSPPDPTPCLAPRSCRLPPNIRSPCACARAPRTKPPSPPLSPASEPKTRSAEAPTTTSKRAASLARTFKTRPPVASCRSTSPTLC